MSSLIDRAKSVLTAPRDFFEKARSEPATLPDLIKGYAAYLAAIPAIGNLIGYGIIGKSFMGHRVTIDMQHTIPYTILWYLISLAAVAGVSILAAKLAPSFGGTEDVPAAAKAVIYSNTAAWVAGVFYIIPALSVIALLGGIYSLYLLYLSTGIVIGIPDEKRIGYLVVLIIATVVAFLIVGAIAGLALPKGANIVF